MRVAARGLFIAVVMVIHGLYFSIIEAGQVFAYDAFVRTRNSEINESIVKYVKGMVRSQKGLVPFSAAKSGAKFESKMADKQK